MNYDALITGISDAHRQAQAGAAEAVNRHLILRNWLIGAYLIEFEQNGEDRAQYGAGLLTRVSGDLRKRGIEGTSPDLLERMRLLYQAYPQFRDHISATLSRKLSFTLPAGADFLNGVMSWGVKSNPQSRSFGLAPVTPGQPFFVTDEANLTTWAADVNPDGSLDNFRLFAEQGGEGVAVDSRGNVYIAAGQIYVYSPTGKLLGTIEVPERPLQLVFGGPDRKTLFIPARTSLYAIRMRYPGR